MRARTIFAATVMPLFLVCVVFAQENGRTVDYEFTYADTKEYVCGCEGFDVLVDYVSLYRGKVILDKNGDPARQVQKYTVIGQARYYNSENPELTLYGGPGEGLAYHFAYEDGIWYSSGPVYKIKVPGYGVVFYETGLTAYNTRTGEFDRSTGHNDFVAGDVEAICRFLTPIP